jgi:hypothetical protein
MRKHLAIHAQSPIDLTATKKKGYDGTNKLYDLAELREPIPGAR